MNATSDKFLMGVWNGIEDAVRRPVAAGAGHNRRALWAMWMAVAATVVSTTARPAAAQNSSLYQQEKNLVRVSQPLTLHNSSFTYQPGEAFRVIKLHDHITVVVTETDELRSNSTLSRRKTMSLEATLKDWVMLDGFGIKKAPQAAGDPSVNGTYNGNIRETADLQSADSLKFRITAEVVDIRPNGDLVLEAHKEIRHNDEIWDYSLAGVARGQDIQPNNLVLSERLAELRIEQRTRGQVRDGYRRGWITKLIDKYGAF